MSSPEAPEAQPAPASNILDLPADDLANVLRTVHDKVGLLALASTRRCICAIARSHVPCKLRLKDASDVCAFSRLQLDEGRRPRFSGAASIVVEKAACCLLSMVVTAAAQMTALRSLELTLSSTTAAEVEAEVYIDGAKVPALIPTDGGSLAGRIPLIFGLQQLRHLELKTSALGNSAAVSLGRLKQLTSLHVTPTTEGMGYRSTPDLSPLSGLTNLVELKVVWRGEIMAPAAEAGPFCLPTSLKRLWADNDSWLPHLPACPQLLQLEIRRPKDGAAAVVEGAVRWTTGLQQLSVTEQPYHHPCPPIQWTSLALLTALQHLDAAGALCLEGAADWYALGRLRGLTCLGGIKVHEGPPQGWQHTGLVELKPTMDLSDPQAAVRVLVGFPALRKAAVNLLDLHPPPGADAAAVGGNAPPPVLRASPHLTTLAFIYQQGPAAKWVDSMVAAAGSSVLDLTLFAAKATLPSDLYPQLPDLSACTALTTLFIRDLAADVGDLVGMLQPLVPTLQVLRLSNMTHISPAAAKVLQHVLPRLGEVRIGGCRKMAREDPSSGSEEEQLQRLRGQLRPGLKLTVS